MDKPVQLFLSYTREDEAAVAQLYERLATVGLKPWMDQEDILPGEIWQESILHAIRDSHFFLACVSPNSVEKRGVLQRELREALDAWKDKLPGDIYLIPVRLEDCAVPEQLIQFQWVDIFHSRGWTRLLRAIQRGTERLDLPVPGGVLSELAPAPTSAKTPPPTPHLLTIDKPIHLELVRVPAGPFLMGDDKHTVDLPEYYIGKYPVTNQQYAAFVQATNACVPNHWKEGKIPAGKENHPVVWITWDESVAFCQWLSQVSSHEIRLPSQTEWEKAARGTDGPTYPWGNEPPPNPSLCNFTDSGINDTTPVDRYPTGASPYGALDMAGNVWEWTADKDKDGYSRLKGGAYWNDAENMRLVAGDRNNPSNWDDYFGFRVLAVPISRLR